MQPARVHGTVTPPAIAAWTLALMLACGAAQGGAIQNCGNGVLDFGEECDDNNAIDGDGCTSQCRLGALCRVSDRPGADALSPDPQTGNCYARYVASTTFDAAATACTGEQGHLVTITAAAEQERVAALVGAGPAWWIGASEDANDMDTVFDWVTGEPWAYTAFAPGQPDDDFGSDGNGDCLAVTPTGWNDANCVFDGYAVGRICEFQARIFADGFE